jgi:hypothetical protein
MAKRVAKRARWTKALLTELRRHSKARTPVAKIAKQMKRTEGALGQQALKLGIGLGHSASQPSSRHHRCAKRACGLSSGGF